MAEESLISQDGYASRNMGTDNGSTIFPVHAVTAVKR
jgi:hypothetical protein